LLCILIGTPLSASVETPLASYEPSETDLIIARGGADVGLTLTVVMSGQDGAPTATDGDHLLKLEFAGEDGKVEYRHTWTGSTYDLAGQDALLADVYIDTPSALPSIMGVWEPTWSPPDTWQPATGLPTATGSWTTITMNLQGRTQTDLNRIWAFIFENMPGSSGVAYVDNLRFSRAGGLPAPTWLTAFGSDAAIELNWHAVSAPDLLGYNVYRSETRSGPYTRLNDTPVEETHYTDYIGEGGYTFYYYVTAVTADEESPPSDTVAAGTGVSDDELLSIVQQMSFRYFWDYAHPVSGLTREGLQHWNEICTSGGSGMGLMTIVVGVERGFVTRAEAADRVLQALTFLEDVVDRYHGAWPHWFNGTTGETIPFSPQDDGGDLVETAYLVQGMLTVRQYFDDPDDPVETEIRTRATRMWEGVEWDWYRRYPDGEILYWHWSPVHGWAMDLPITGYDETMITYLLAIASPTHPMPASSWGNGYARMPYYTNGNEYYGFMQWVGPPFGGPLFFTHYSFLGFDPRYKRDAYCNYFDNSRNISLIHQAYCIDNPLEFAGYGPSAWGLTASTNPWGYSAHSPTNDNGTIAPTAALSAMPYTPDESKAALRHFIYLYTDELWGPYGFYDAYNADEWWFSDTVLAIDQGPIIIMIENYRTGLCWDLFMANPEIKPMLVDIGWSFGGDLNGDYTIDLADYALLAACVSGPDEPTIPPGCPPERFDSSDLDNDDDVDLADLAIFSRLLEMP
jgi:hypothetical protein